MRPTNNQTTQRAQIFMLFALSLPVLILFMGLGVDLGFAFVTRANLSKAVDAAALAAMRNINQGQAQATAIAQSAFNTNYGSGLGATLARPCSMSRITHGRQQQRGRKCQCHGHDQHLLSPHVVGVSKPCRSVPTLRRRAPS